jgi:hypothetical protein
MSTIIVKCKKMDKQWKVKGPWESHERYYLKSPPEAFDGLHAAMRKIGIDWFTWEHARSPQHTQNISKALKGRRPIRPRKRWKRSSYNKPNTKEWMIVTTNGTYSVTNLKDWVRRNGLSLDAIRTRIKRNRWPYTPPQYPQINILRISKWSK